MGMTNIRSEDDDTPDAIYASFTPEQQAEVDAMRRNPNIYRDMAVSLAPTVYGHEDVKKAVLLMLLGGVHKQTAEVSGWCTCVLW